MVSNSQTRTHRQFSWTRSDLGPLPLRFRLAAYWLLAGLVLPAAAVAGGVWLPGPLGELGATAVVPGADALAVCVTAALVARNPRLAGLGIALSLGITWALLALGYIVLTTAGR